MIDRKYDREDEVLRARVETWFHTVLAACGSSDWPTVMAHVAYQGSDSTRRYKAPWRAADPEAMQVVNGLCATFPKPRRANTIPPVEVTYLRVRPRTKSTASHWVATVVVVDNLMGFFAFVEPADELLLGELQIDR